MKKIKVEYFFHAPKNFTGIAEKENGSKAWFQNGKLHRDDGGPAAIYSNGNKVWYQHDKLHRADDPAVEWHCGGREYWINGEETYKEAVDVFNKLFSKEELELL
jgi:hypothetical protein